MNDQGSPEGDQNKIQDGDEEVEVQANLEEVKGLVGQLEQRRGFPTTIS